MTEYEQLLHTLGAEDQAEAMTEIGRLHATVLAAERTVAAFEALGNARPVGEQMLRHKACESALVAMKATLRPND